MDAPITIGAWIRLRRRTLDLTQDELAVRVGLSVAAIRKIERDERRPSRQTAELLADGLQIAAAERPAFLKAARGELSVSHSQSLVAAARQPVAAAALMASAPHHRRAYLPTPPTPLLGRTNELVEIGRLLQATDCRMLTLVGPGGSGKTRTVIEAANQLQDAFADGVYFVALTSVSTPALIAPTIASAIALKLEGTTTPQQQVVEHLRDKQLLLVLDNLEHLLGGEETQQTTGAPPVTIDWLADLLMLAPQVHLLTTSREPLGLPGEWLFDLQGLPTPPPSTQLGHASEAIYPLAQLANYSAAELFIQTARRTDARFALTTSDAAGVARICQLVDGLPLAIELAASWVRTLTCTEIASEIERSIDFLATPVRGVPERHRSITAVFDHSWRLLNDEERQVLRRLSVLRGSFSRAAAEAIAGARLPILSALVSKSLVRHVEPQRYDLHELVRQYLAAHLRAHPDEEQATLDRHAAYFVEWLRTHAIWLRGSREGDARAAFTLEADNIRMMMARVMRQREINAIRSATLDMIDFFEWLNWFQEAEAVFAQAVQQLEESTAVQDEAARAALGYALLGHGAFTCRIGNNAVAQEKLLRSLAIQRANHDTAGLVRTLYWLTLTGIQLGQNAEAQRWGQEGLALAEPLPDRNIVVRCRNLLGFAAVNEGDYAQAEAYFRSGLAEARQLGNQNLRILLLNNLASALRSQQKYDEAQAALEESRMLAEQTGERRLLAYAQRGLGQLAFAQGDFASAHRWFQQSLTTMRSIREVWVIPSVLAGLGQAALALGQVAEARQTFAELFRQAVNAGLQPRILDALVGFAQLHRLDQQDEQARVLLVQVNHHPAALHETRTLADQLLAELTSGWDAEQMAQWQATTLAEPFETLLARYKLERGIA
jgi:predicted ATPase/transcriptional regulator with XRE-family HTH domain